jgi:nucleotide-binding universal stress UspA family protein
VTILVAYVPRPEGQAALDKGIELATRNHEDLMVVNAIAGDGRDEPAMADTQDVERVEKLLERSGVDGTFKQFVRGKSPIEEIQDMVDSMPVSLVIIGLRKRSPVGKLLLGSVAQEILLTVSCPVLAVKAL